jgi:hypothetical protein
MEISPTWIGIILISITLLFFLHWGLRMCKGVKEGFLNSPSSPLTSDIQLNSCPANSTRFVNSSGQSLCCDGSIVDNQCSGKTLCSLSEQAGTIPTCGEWYAAWLAERGANRCFPGMPNYFEDKATGVKGCTSGPRKPDGSGPASANQKKCILYNSQKDENDKSDSCTNMGYFDYVMYGPWIGREVPVQKVGRFDNGKKFFYIFDDTYTKMVAEGNATARYIRGKMEFNNITQDFWNSLSKADGKYLAKRK